MGFFKLWGFFPRGLGIFSNMVIFILGIGDFFLRGLEILENLGIFIAGIFTKLGIFYPRNFSGWGFFGDGDFPPKSHLCFLRL